MPRTLAEFLVGYAEDQLTDNPQVPIWAHSRSEAYLKARLTLRNLGSEETGSEGPVIPAQTQEKSHKPTLTPGKLKARKHGKRDRASSAAIVSLRDHYELRDETVLLQEISKTHDATMSLPEGDVERLSDLYSAERPVATANMINSAPPGSLNDCQVEPQSQQLGADRLTEGNNGSHEGEECRGGSAMQLLISEPPRPTPGLQLTFPFIAGHANARAEKEVTARPGPDLDPFVSQEPLQLSAGEEQQDNDEWDDFQESKEWSTESQIVQIQGTRPGTAATGLGDLYDTLPDLSFMLSQELCDTS